MSLSICPWKYGKRWVYSITYDEALADLHRFAIPMHEEYAIPGHVELLVGQMGEIRQADNSSYNGYRQLPLSAGNSRASQQGLAPRPSYVSALRRCCPREAMQSGAQCPRKSSATI